MALKYHDDWQSSKKTISERNAYMFNNELLSDVSFTCGESSRIFHAHKYVLATSSAVFFAMFHGDLAQKESTIRISDTDEKSLEEFLRFLYTDECKITAENAIGVMYLAKKYLVPSLAEKCSKVLEENVKPDDVFMTLEQAIKFDEKKLEEKCWDIVSKKTPECVNSEAFYNIGSLTVNALLKRHILKVSEVELFRAVLKWIDRECARQGIDIENKTARRRVIGDNVYNIRFLDMSLEDFAKTVSSTGILTETEVISIFQKFSGLDVADLKWKKLGKRWRHYREVEFPLLYHCIYYGKGNAGPDGTISDSLTLSVNKAGYFNGVRLFGADGSEYEVQLRVKDKKVAGTYTSNNDGYDVKLSTPVSLQPDEEFTVSATIKGPDLDSYWGSRKTQSVKNSDTVVTFKTSESSKTDEKDQNDSLFWKIYLAI